MIIQIVDLTIVYHQSAEEKRELFSRKTNQSQILSWILLPEFGYVCVSEPLTLISEKDFPD